MSCGCGSSDGCGGSCGTSADGGGCGSGGGCGKSYKLSVFDWLADVEQPTQDKCNFYEVRFKNNRKGIYDNVNNLPVHIGSIVVVEPATSGYDIGVVSLTGELVKIQMKKKKVADNQSLKIYRLANAEEIELWQKYQKKEDSVKIEARKIARALGLKMKISDVEYQADGNKITFYYTAESRVDFRQLIKEYASAFHSKIDMKQIGYRQEAAKIGGLSSSGRELCCSTWLTDFRSVSTQAARYQQLSINPQKLAGQCGKLKCCLNFELDSYVDALKDFPSSSTTLQTEKGKAFCIKIDVFKKRMWFAYVENSMSWYNLTVDKVKELVALNKSGQKVPPLEDLTCGDTGVSAKAESFATVEEIPAREERERKKNYGDNRRNNKKPNRNGPKKPPRTLTDQGAANGKPGKQHPRKGPKKRNDKG